MNCKFIIKFKIENIKKNIRQQQVKIKKQINNLFENRWINFLSKHFYNFQVFSIRSNL